jgi:hypothetical protein
MHSGAVKWNVLTPKQALTVRWPTCSVGPGKRCELSTGGLRTTAHRDRILEYRIGHGATEKGNSVERSSGALTGSATGPRTTAGPRVKSAARSSDYAIIQHLVHYHQLPRLGEGMRFWERANVPSTW